MSLIGDACYGPWRPSSNRETNVMPRGYARWCEPTPRPFVD